MYAPCPHKLPQRLSLMFSNLPVMQLCLLGTMTRQPFVRLLKQNSRQLLVGRSLTTGRLMLPKHSVVIAGTGSGKTMPFRMPLLLDEARDKIVLVISPLNELEFEQVSLYSKERILALLRPLLMETIILKRFTRNLKKTLLNDISMYLNRKLKTEHTVSSSHLPKCALNTRGSLN